MSGVLSLFVSIILMLVSIIHVYWLSGGKKGATAAIPSDGVSPLFQPSKPATGMVALLLGLASLLVLMLGNVVQLEFLSSQLERIAGWLLAIIFVLRAIGDFRWVGFFKRRRNTQFAKYDTLLYSPLCLFLGLSIIIIVLA